VSSSTTFSISLHKSRREHISPISSRERWWLQPKKQACAHAYFTPLHRGTGQCELSETREGERNRTSFSDSVVVIEKHLPTAIVTSQCKMKWRLPDTSRSVLSVRPLGGVPSIYEDSAICIPADATSDAPEERAK
jgi:hypothetical protein